MNDTLKNVDTGYYYLLAPGMTVASSVSVSTTPSASGRASSLPDKKVESAVYAHIQAVRTLGRTTINTVEIAKALGLPQAVVEGTLAALKKKGIRIQGR